MSQLWGIDLGGTKIEGVVLDSSAEQVIARLRVPTEAANGYEHILVQIEKCLRELESETGLRRAESLGIGTPGAVEPATGLRSSSAPSLPIL